MSGRGKAPGEALQAARKQQRRALVDELAQHPDVFRYLAEREEYRRALVDEFALRPDVFRYLAEQGRDLADEFPMGSREHLTLRLFDQACREVAVMLERAEMMKAAAS